MQVQRTAFSGMKVLCVFGEHQYGDPARGIGTEYAAFMPALKRLGHEVIHFESWNRTRYQDFRELNRALLKTIEQQRPDVMLAVQMNYEIWLETLEIIKARRDVATVCWTTDDSWKYREVSRFIGRAYHAMTTTYEQVLPFYQRDRIPHVLLTQWAARLENLQEPLAADSCRYQVSFVGAAHGDRRERMSELERLGVDVSCFGHGWPSGSVDADEIPQIMRESVISLNFSNSKGENQVKARTFEVPGAGGFLLTENVAALEKFYIPGKEIVTFGSVQELAEKIKYYLAHPRERDAIARAGFARTSRDHTYDLRLKEVLDFAIQAQRDYMEMTPKVPVSSFEKASERYRQSRSLKILRAILVALCVAIWGRRRGRRAARRLLFEASWRLFGAKTFSAAGWPGILFYSDS